MSRMPAKFANPDNPAETWCGYEARPLWLKAKLEAGHDKSEFAINCAK
jgi:DNA-binding protein H-NS